MYHPTDEKVNEARYNLLGHQLKIYDKYNIAWSIWLYKDIGLQGMITTAPDSTWNKTLAPFLAKKSKFQTDAWGYNPSAEVDAVFLPMVKWIEAGSPTAKDKYPTTWNVERHLSRIVKQCLLSDTLQDEFAGYFKGMSKEELDKMARSFAFGECRQREGLNKILREHAAVRGD